MKYSHHKYESLRFDIIAHWDDKEYNHEPDYFTLEFGGEAFGPSRIEGPDKPDWDTVIDYAKECGIIDREKDRALALLRPLEAKEGWRRFEGPNILPFMDSLSEEECYSVIWAANIRVRAIEKAAQLVGKFRTDMVCEICGIHFDARVRDYLDTCCTCYKLYSGKESGATEYKEHDGRRDESEWMPIIEERRRKRDELAKQIAKRI